MVTLTGCTHSCYCPNHFKAKAVGILVDLQRFNPGSDLQGWPTVGANGEVRTKVLNLVQMAGPYGEGARADIFGIEIVTLILDAQTQVQIASKVDSQLDLGHIGHIDNVRWHTAERARRRIRRTETGWQASHALEERPINTSGLR